MRDKIVTANLSNGNLVKLTFLRENITLDVTEVKEGWEKARKLSPEKKAMVLLKTGRWTLLEDDARRYVIRELKTWPAVAIVVDNLGQRIMGQVVINLTGKRNQIKLFECETKAAEWLKGKSSKN